MACCCPMTAAFGLRVKLRTLNNIQVRQCHFCHSCKGDSHVKRKGWGGGGGGGGGMGLVPLHHSYS